jgi:hypothetical protein
MKIRVTFKDPDNNMSEQATKAVNQQFPGLSAAAAEIEAENAVEKCGRWVEYGEYVTIEIDTEAGTATVVPKRG